MLPDPSAPKHRPYRRAAAAFQIGLKPMTMAEWLDVGPDHVDFMAAKRSRLKGRPPLYYGSLPESRAAQDELRDVVAAHLAAHHADTFARCGDRMTDLLDGTVHDLRDPAREPLEAIADLTEEDFVIFEKRDGRDIVTATSNAYSSSGRIASTVGHGMSFAHGPVPGLNDQLGSRIDRVMANIRVDAPVVRFNWFVTAIGDRLYPVRSEEHYLAATAPARAALDADHRQAGDLLWLRVERQTFVRLPSTGALAFGIHTYSHPFHLLAGDRDSLSAIHALLSDYAEDRLRYSGMLDTRAPILRWIEDQLA
ncbi:MAG TPA: DUF3445 domain-containing protein [Aestuariivirga sp.]|nr:DUF3445 domain-containing protein [Aestuariivirga sp.]